MISSAAASGISALDLELERLLEESGSLLAGHAQDGGVVGRAPVGVREPDPHDLFPYLTAFAGKNRSAARA
jgi:hypothetical protein